MKKNSIKYKIKTIVAQLRQSSKGIMTSIVLQGFGIKRIKGFYQSKVIDEAVKSIVSV